jgi:hypothetical protein
MVVSFNGSSIGGNFSHTVNESAPTQPLSVTVIIYVPETLTVLVVPDPPVGDHILVEVPVEPVYDNTTELPVQNESSVAVITGVGIGTTLKYTVLEVSLQPNESVAITE